MNKKFLSVLLAGSMVVSLFSGMSVSFKNNSVNADAAAMDTANLRLIYTSDLHGQVTTTDYTSGKIITNESLAKDATLIKQARNEVGSANTCLFDLGDVLYDYTTDYIYESDETAIQPIYKAMASLGYDAITIGNHEFQYTLSYLKQQLTDTGFSDKVVLSNVKDVNTGSNIYSGNKIIEKTIKTKAGNSITVKVGIIGETQPTLSEMRQDYTGVLSTEDILVNATNEAASLKAQGADIVVVLAHSGIGGENPETNAEDVGYALTKVPNIDVVLCGHRHCDFDADDTTTIYSSLPGIDTTNHTVNGKNLIQLAPQGQSIGVVDLNIYDVNGTKYIASRDEEVRKPDNSTTADSDINNNYLGTWATTFITDCSEGLADIDSSASMQNYFGTNEDNGVIQLLNDIKISYGLKYVNSTDTQYKDLPVIAASNYLKYGDGDGDGYIDLSGQFNKSNMYDLIKYKSKMYLYKITGSQLREWLEWTASAYETAKSNPVIVVTAEPQATDVSTTSAVEVTSPAAVRQTESVATATPDNTDEITTSVPKSTDNSQIGTKGAVKCSTAGNLLKVVEKIANGLGAVTAKAAQITRTVGSGMAGLIKNSTNSLDGVKNYSGSESLQCSLQSGWLTDWSRYYVFDGIEYTIDTSKKPRYDIDGNLINNTNRVTSLTRNGVAINDGDTFVLVSQVAPTSNATSSIAATEITHSSAAVCRKYVSNYIQKIAMNGTLKNTQDDNWKIKYSNDLQYLVMTGENATSTAAEKTWITSLLDSENKYNYYQADFEKMSYDDTTGPCVNAVSLNDEETSNDITIQVQATDVSGIASVKYIKGKYTKDSAVWNLSATTMTSSSFNVDENAVYSILATDTKGNSTLDFVRIDNYNESVLEAPKVSSYTNRMKTIKGTATANAKIFFELQSGKIYKTTVNSSGSFSYALPPQNANKKVYVYVEDDEGRASARTVVTVKRTGPNKPVFDEVGTNTNTITGNINDTYSYPALIVDDATIYVSNEGGEDLYKKCEIYRAAYKVVKVKMTIDSDGDYSFRIPKALKAGVKVKMYTIDAVSRKSLVYGRTVKQKKPDKPVIVASGSAISNTSTKVKISSDEKCTVYLKIGKKVYKSSSASYKSSTCNYYYTVKIPRTDCRDAIKVYATNKKGSSTKYKAKRLEKVPDTPKVNKVKSGARTIKGKVDIVGSGETQDTLDNTKTKVCIYIYGVRHLASVKANGTFTYKTRSRMYYGTSITIIARNINGNSKKKKIKVK